MKKKKKLYWVTEKMQLIGVGGKTIASVFPATREVITIDDPRAMKISMTGYPEYGFEFSGPELADDSDIKQKAKRKSPGRK